MLHYNKGCEGLCLGIDDNRLVLIVAGTFEGNTGDERAFDEESTKARIDASVNSHGLTPVAPKRYRHIPWHLSPDLHPGSPVASRRRRNLLFSSHGGHERKAHHTGLPSKGRASPFDGKFRRKIAIVRR